MLCQTYSPRTQPTSVDLISSPQAFFAAFTYAAVRVCGLMN